MKKTFLPSFLILGILFSGVACSNIFIPEQDDDPQGLEEDSGLITISATLEQHDTKSSLSNNNVLWSEGDEIRVFCSSDTSEDEGVVFTLSSGAGTTDATFSGVAPSGEGPFYAVYPASLPSVFDGTSLSVTLPEVQAYAENSFGNGANYAVSRTDELENLSFKNLCGALFFSFTGNKTIRFINVYTNGPENLNGKALVSYDGEAPSLTFLDGQSGEPFQKLSLDCGVSGSALGSATKAFYLTLPAGALSSGFTVEVLDDEDNGMIRSGTDAQIERSSVRPMPALAYSPQYKADFLLSDYLAAAFTGTLAANGTFAAPCHFSTTSGQYSYRTVEANRVVRIQDWDAGYALTLTAPGTLNLGNSGISVSASSIGDVSGINSQSGVKVIKSTGKRVWLVSPDTGTGFIILKED